MGQYSAPHCCLGSGVIRSGVRTSFFCRNKEVPQDGKVVLASVVILEKDEVKIIALTHPGDNYKYKLGLCLYFKDNKPVYN